MQRVLFRKWQYLPRRGQSLAVMIDEIPKGDNPDMRVAYFQNGEKTEVDMYTVKFRTTRVLPENFETLFDKLNEMLEGELLVIESLSEIRSERLVSKKYNKLGGGKNV